MIWVSHDFYNNFTKSVNSNDIGLALDIFRSELSDLLTYKSKELYSLFDKLKIKYKKNSSYEELLDIILRQAKINDKFVRGLSFVICENNQVMKNNPKISWVNLLNKITKGIKKIIAYFRNNPRQEMLFRKKTLDMIELKSSITGDDNRDLKKKDNTVLWIIGTIAVGVVGYFIWKHYDTKLQAKLRAESLLKTNDSLALGGSLLPPTTPMVDANGVAVQNNVAPAVVQNNVGTPTVAPVVAQQPVSNDAGYNVSPSVLVPMQPVVQQPMVQQQNNMQVAQPINNNAQSINSTQQLPVNI